jgi:hypothetical protein
LPNCWRPIFLVLPKSDGCQVGLANCWSCYIYWNSGTIIKISCCYDYYRRKSYPNSPITAGFQQSSSADNSSSSDF